MRITPWPAWTMFVVAFTAGCGKPLTTLNRLAAAGSIQEDAPVKADLQVEIGAPAAKVWTLLIDAASWPKWQRDIESVNVQGPLAGGKRFSWRAGGIEIHSQVQLFEPQRRLAWTGTAMTARAIHLWELKSESPDRTLVIVKESMEGPGISMLYPSKQLTETDRGWLAALVKAAERNP